LEQIRDWLLTGNFLRIVFDNRSDNGFEFLWYLFRLLEFVHYLLVSWITLNLNVSARTVYESRLKESYIVAELLVATQHEAVAVHGYDDHRPILRVSNYRRMA